MAFAGVERDPRAACHVRGDAAQAVDQCLEWLQKRIGAQDQLFRFSTGELALLATRPDGAGIEALGDRLVKVAEMVEKPSPEKAPSGCRARSRARSAT